MLFRALALPFHLRRCPEAPLMTRSVNGGFENRRRDDQHRMGRAKALNYIFPALSNFESYEETEIGVKCSVLDVCFFIRCWTLDVRCWTFIFIERSTRSTMLTQPAAWPPLSTDVVQGFSPAFGLKKSSGLKRPRAVLSP